MEKTYTKKQITEAIAYWEKQLKKLNESENDEYFNVHVYNIDWQPVDDEDDDDTFKDVVIDVSKSEIDLSKLEEIIHDYLFDHCQSSGPESYDYEITIKSSGN